jgi:hypothetical protein
VLLRGRRLGRDAAFVAVSGLAMLAIMAAIRRGISDDAYITLAYAKNMALHLHWGLIPSETANTATSPLMVLLLAAVSAVTRVTGDVHPVVALTVVSVGLSMALAWGWLRIQRALALPFWTAVLGVGLVVLDPFLLSSMGLEVLLIATLLVLMVALAVEERPGAFGAVAGLALITRFDLIVFVVAIALATPGLRRSWLRATGFVLATSGPWFVFSWFVLDSLIPDTVIVKLASRGGWGQWTYLTGPRLYSHRWPGAVAVTFVPAAAGLAMLLWWIGARGWRRHARLVAPAALAAGGVAYYLAYAGLGLPPFHWYYTPPTIALGTAFVIGLGALCAGAPALLRGVRVSAVAVALTALFLAAKVAVDASDGVPWRTPLIATNWASPAQYARIGVDLRRRVHGAAVQGPGEVGTMAYFCDCAIVDNLSDRGRTTVLINDAMSPENSHLKRFLLHVNYAWLDRKRQPRPAAYRMYWGSGPGSGPDSWPVYEVSKGPGHIQLVRAQSPPTPLLIK